MGSVHFEVDQEFKTKGIWAKKGTKNLILSSKDAAAKVKEPVTARFCLMP